MKIVFLMVLTVALVSQWVSANTNSTDTVLVTTSPNKIKFVEMVGRKLRSLWAKFAVQAEENKDSFAARCFGAARKLKMMIPLIVFKLGVIVTILGFLTLFSVKSLGLLGLLLLINTSGIVSKLAVALAGKHDDSKKWKQQSVHLHVHQDKEGHYDVGHSGYGWEEKFGDNGDDELNNIESYNLYNKLNRNILLRQSRDINR